MRGALCHWCGHLSHADECPSRIQTSPKTTAPCPCAKRGSSGPQNPG